MRYRRLSYRYTMMVPSGQRWPFPDTWESDRLRFFVPARWRPDADLYETATTIEIIVDLAGVAEDEQAARGAMRALDDLTEAIIDAAIQIHRDLGPGLLESVYEVILAHQLRQLGGSCTILRS